MNKNLPIVGALVTGLSLVFSISVVADPIRLFGPPEPGHARPPLWMNTTPATFGNNTTPPYTPQQVQLAYGFNQLYSNGVTGTGETIAIVDAYDDSQYLQNDLNAFDTQFGLPAIKVQILYGSGTKPPPNTGWQEEISLDVEWAHAIAPGAKIILVEAADNSTANLLQAVKVAGNNGANVVSMSWGGGEYEGENTEDSFFTKPGVAYVASAGDSGTGVEWPAGSPNVIAVGGTSLILNAMGGYGSEAAWDDSGGGISVIESQPVWQNHWFQTSWTPMNRGVPDVAYLADPNYGVYVAYAGSWYEFGGTSVGAPQWSALIALADQGRTTSLSNNIGKTIYAIANGGGTTAYGGYTINPTYFNDVTTGADGGAQDNAAYPGYDLVTGVGSPVASNVVTALNGGAPPPPTPNFTITASPGSQTVTPGGSNSYTVTVTGTNGYAGTVDLTVSGLPAGATPTFTPGTVTGSGGSTLSIQTSPSTPGGTYTLTITGTDTTGSPVHSTTVTLKVANFGLSVSPNSQTVAPGGATSYTVTVTASNGYSGTVDFAAGGLPSGTTATFVPPSVVGSGSTSMNIQTSATTPTGTDTLTVTGTDSTGSPTSSANTSLVVSTATGTSMTVKAITYLTSGSGHVNLDITARVDTTTGIPVANASVSITVDLNGSPYATGTATTSSTGQAQFVLDNAPAGTYTTIVTSVTESGYAWDGNYPANSYADPY